MLQQRRLFAAAGLLVAVTLKAQEATSAVPPPRTYSTGQTTALGARVFALLGGAEVSRAHWGIAVTTMDGTPVFGLDEGKLFRPASSAKLFTTAAAMAVLGPDHTVETTVRGDFDAGTGTVKGDLNLVGGGDPSFGTDDLPYKQGAEPGSKPRDLIAFADQLVARGLRHVAGDVVGDDALLGREPPPEGWAAEDLVWGYGALPSALSVGDNQLRLTISPAAKRSSETGAGDGAVGVEQLAPYLVVENDVSTLPKSAEAPLAVGVAVSENSPQALRVFGAVAAGSPPIVEHVAIHDAGMYAAMALKQLLVDRGIQVDGEAKSFHAETEDPHPYLAEWRELGGCGSAYPGEKQSCTFSCLSSPRSGQVLASHTSLPLRDEVVYTLKTSANLHAELLLRQMGLENSCPGSGAVHGARLIRTWLLHIGIEEGDFVFYDGSGLSTKDLVTPRAEAQLLAYAGKQPWFAVWKTGLPVGGMDGTLAGRFTSAPLKGHVFAKTGTLGESRALAGYVMGASGRELVFSILVDTHEPGSTADRVVMDKIVEAIAAED